MATFSLLDELIILSDSDIFSFLTLSDRHPFTNIIQTAPISLNDIFKYYIFKLLNFRLTDQRTRLDETYKNGSSFFILHKGKQLSPESSCCIFTHQMREVLLCFEQCGSLLMTSQLSSGRIWCQSRQEGEESSAYYTSTAMAASLGSHEYLDNCWPRLMCTPIRDGYLTPLEGLLTGPCQAAQGFQYHSQCPIILFC